MFMSMDIVTLAITKFPTNHNSVVMGKLTINKYCESFTCGLLALFFPSWVLPALKDINI